MCHNSDKYMFDRVSGAEGEEDTPIICSELQYITNAHSDTNTADDIASQEIQTRDQKQLISDTLTHDRQETITSCAIWLPNDNSVDRQSERQYKYQYKYQ